MRQHNQTMRRITLNCEGNARNIMDGSAFKTSIFPIILQIGGSRCVQNTPTGCGNNLPILLRNLTFDRNCHLLIQSLYMAIVCSNLYFLLCLKQHAPGKMTGPTMGSFHGFHEK